MSAQKNASADQNVTGEVGQNPTSHVQIQALRHADVAGRVIGKRSDV